MKQRRHLSNKITAAVAASILSIALTGTACGTFAWFMYGARTRVTEYEGTSIGVGNLEVGIFSEEDLPEAQERGLKQDSSDPTLYWFEGHEMPASTINYVLATNGYATTELFPVTTRKYASGDSFNLFSSPRMKSDVDPTASKLGRVYLPLVFRYMDIIEEEYIANEDIYLSRVELEALSPNSEIHRAVRLYTDNKEGNTHLINPSSPEDGVTDVGGALDLNGDGYYDVDENEEDGQLYEHIYGQVKEYEYRATKETDDTPYPGGTTFDAGHKEDTYVLDSCVPEVASYEGMYNFRNMRSEVTTTNPLDNNYARLDLSIFVEGWDRHVIDSEIEMPFNINLQFETKI